MSNALNVKLGACKILFDGIDLGYTKGGVEVEVISETHQVSIDQFGESTVNEFITKRNIKVKCPLAETTLDLLEKIMPGSTIISDQYNPAKRRVNVKSGIGINLYKQAKTLILHPIYLPDSNTSEDLIIYKSATAGAMKFAYKHNEERIYAVDFMGYPDDSNNNILFSYGDHEVNAFDPNQLYDSLGVPLYDSLGAALVSL
jgi:hypothetical protein